VNGTTGLNGVISAANSFFEGGSQFTTPKVIPLANGNYVLDDPDWDGQVGAVTWCTGSGPTTGTVSTGNSLVGTTHGDSVGLGTNGFPGVVALANGNYVVESNAWDDEVGAVTWGDGTKGIAGTISASNSLVGTSSSDAVGFGGITALSNGNYIVDSPNWGGSEGAVTWGNGTKGITGTISAANSLVGNPAAIPADDIGGGGITALANGNYVVYSEGWNDSEGAVTWANGTTGLVGMVTTDNSLVGTGLAAAGDGYAKITALTNGNYVVADPSWDDAVGAVTWGNGATGTIGVISLTNSLVGSNPAGVVNEGDQVGGGFLGSGGVTALAKGNYVVSSPFWDGNDTTGRSGTGAVTWANGTTGITGTISAANSLVGSSTMDQVGFEGVTALANGNYVVGSGNWNQQEGAVTWGDGTKGVTGTISAANSLIGTTPNVNISGAPPDVVGYNGSLGPTSLVALANGNYVVLSSMWNSDTGAATPGNGSTGTEGTVSGGNSVVNPGAFSGGGPGIIPIQTLPNGSSIVGGSGIWLDGATGTILDGKGAADAQNSVPTALGLNNIMPILSGSSFADGASVFFTDPNLLSFDFGAGQTIAVTPDFLTRTLDAGINVTIQSNDDIIINSPIIESPTGTAGSLTIESGRSIIIDAKIDTAGGNLTLIANASLSDGVVDTERDPGDAVIAEQSGASIDTGTGALTVNLEDSTDKTNNGAGAVTLPLVNAASETLSNASTVGITINGTTPGDGTAAGSYTQFNVSGSLNLNGARLAVTYAASTPVGTTFTIVQTTVGVSGTFAGFSEGATVTAADGTQFRISYQGDGGKEVVLTQISVVPTQLVITSQPPDPVAVGGGFGLVVKAEDAAGDVATSYTGSVTVALASNPGGSTLGGMVTVPAVNGVATFSGLTLDQPGSGYTLQATSGGLAAATTNPFDVAVVTTQLVVTTQPPDPVTAGSGFGLVVQAEDGSGNLATSFTGSVTVALLANPGGGTLGGMVTLPAVNGVASFSALTLDQPGTGYTLQVPGSGLTAATTAPFEVRVVPTQLVVTTEPPGAVAAGSGFGLVVKAEDDAGDVATSFSGSITVTLVNNPGGSTLGGTVTLPAVNGVATFSGLTLDQPDSGYTLQATGGSLVPATTAPFRVAGGTGTPAATTTVLATTGPAAFGQPVTLTATVASDHGNADGGTVTFLDGGAALATVAVGGTGVAGFTAVLGPGAHRITAVYSGDGNFQGSTSTAVVVTVPTPLMGDVTALVQATLAPSSMRKKGKPRNFTETLTVRNTGGQPLAGPLSVVLRGLRSTVKLRGAAGFVGSKKKRSPYVVLSVAGGVLGPGDSVSMTLQFGAKPNQPTLAVFADSSPR
jgi:hypothetical protein